MLLETGSLLMWDPSSSRTFASASFKNLAALLFTIGNRRESRKKWAKKEMREREGKQVKERNIDSKRDWVGDDKKGRATLSRPYSNCMRTAHHPFWHRDLSLGARMSSFAVSILGIA
jgi:hypothetical protein